MYQIETWLNVNSTLFGESAKRGTDTFMAYIHEEFSESPQGKWLAGHGIAYRVQYQHVIKKAADATKARLIIGIENGKQAMLFKLCFGCQ